MNCLAPGEAATLATDIYSVNKGDQIELEFFLKNPLFSSDKVKSVSANSRE